MRTPSLFGNVHKQAGKRLVAASKGKYGSPLIASFEGNIGFGVKQFMCEAFVPVRTGFRCERGSRAKRLVSAGIVDSRGALR